MKKYIIQAYKWLFLDRQMLPIETEFTNEIYGKDQPPYLPLPVFKQPNDEEGKVVSTWSISLRDRLRILLTGRCHIIQLTFNGKMQPLLPSVKNPVTFVEEQKGGI